MTNHFLVFVQIRILILKERWKKPVKAEMKIFLAKFFFTLFFLVPVESAAAQNFSGGFDFYLPPQDTTTQRFLPSFPPHLIAPNEFVSIDNQGHFSVNGKRIRFFGTNAVTGGAFPTKSKAWFVAGRLRKMGFNLVRFHHMDNHWSTESLFIRGQGTRHLNPTTLDRLENFIAALKRNGIYADINLHVSRTFEPMDGVPDADSIRNFAKGVSYFDPILIALQKEYARELLTHVNPYTHQTLANDPVMAMVEITNENSLFRMWRDGKLRHFSQGGDLAIRHVRMLDSLWQAFLTDRYGTTENLRASWDAGSHPEGAQDFIYGGGFETNPTLNRWQLELHNGARGTMGITTVEPFSGLILAKVSITQADGINWHVQWKQIGLSLVKDSLYTVSFAARADAPKKITVAVMKDVSPWTSFSVATLQLTSGWQTFTLSFRAPEECHGNVRLSFELGASTGTYRFDEIHMRFSGIAGLLQGKSFENGTVRRIDYANCAAFSDNRVKDMTAFYLKIEDEFFADMTHYLKNNLGVRCPIVGTNWNVGVGDLIVQSKLDYVDNHGYWDHPQFPHIPWSSTDWLINNTPMVLDENGGTIPYLFGGIGFAGKPFTVSEYNHPFPNRYQTEGVLFLTGYSAFYNSDAIMFFDYSDKSDDWETDKIDSYFSLHRNTAMMALMPSCARAFREGWIQPSREEIHLNYSQEQVLLSPKWDAGHWQGMSLFPRKLALQHAVRNTSFDSPDPLDPEGLPAEPQPPYASDTGELLWNTKGIFRVATPRFVGLTGFLQNFTGLCSGNLTLLSAADFATLTWLSLTGDSLSRARRSLLTLSTKAQNTGMIWDGAHTIHNNWGTPPTEVYPTRVNLWLKIEADSIRVYPLDEKGRELTQFKTYTPDSKGRFRVILNQFTNQTVWFGIEALGVASHILNQNNSGVQPEDFWVSQNFPNPVHATSSNFRGTVINYFLPRSADIRIELTNILGQRIFLKHFCEQTAGNHQFLWQGMDENGNLLQSGVYFFRIFYQTSQHQKEKTRKILLFNDRKFD